MIQKVLHIVALLFLVILGAFSSVYAQGEYGYLSFKGTTTFKGKALPNARVEAYRGGKKFAESLSNKQGRFELKIEYAHQYEIKFVIEGKHTMKMLVDANIPKNYLPLWATFSINVPFFALNDSTIEKNHFVKPFNKVAFNEARMKFMDDHTFIDGFWKVNDAGITPGNKELPEDLKPLTPVPIKPVNQNGNDLKRGVSTMVANKKEIQKNRVEKTRKETELIKDIKTSRNEENKGETKNALIETEAQNKSSEREEKQKVQTKKNYIKKTKKTNDLFKERAKATQNTGNQH